MEVKGSDQSFTVTFLTTIIMWMDDRLLTKLNYERYEVRLTGEYYDDPSYRFLQITAQSL